MKRKSLREILTENDKALKGMAAMMGKPITHESPIIKPKREYVKSDIPSEHSEQVKFVMWWRYSYPTDLILAIPNGGTRDIIEASRLKQSGVVRGIPDLFIPSWRLWIEMKRSKGGTISDEQRTVAAYLTNIGYKHIFGFGFEDAKAKVLELAQ